MSWLGRIFGRRPAAPPAPPAPLGRRGYDAAKHGRLTDGWVAGSSGPVSELRPALSTLRNRSRDLVRNNPHFARTVQILTANLVGAGITARPQGAKRQAQRFLAAWSAWSSKCDFGGKLTFPALQALAVRAMVTDGEVIIRKYLDRSDPTVAPLRLQLLEADYLDTTRDGFLAGPTGQNLIMGGIETDPQGRRVAYYLWRFHPGEAAWASRSSFASDRVPADQIIHLYRVDRPGQLRGAPWLAPVILKARDLNDYTDAALMKAKIEACVSLVLELPSAEDRAAVAPAQTDPETGELVETLSPGLILRTRPGEKATTLIPTGNSVFEPYALHHLMAIAAGAGITYDQLTGDLRQANYSSLRAGKIEMRQLVEQHQQLTIIPQLLDAVAQAFTWLAQLGGQLGPGAYPLEWIVPRVQMVDPLKDMQAAILEVRSGAMTVGQFFASYGVDADAQLDEIAKWNAAMDQLGIALDVDPRRVNAKGLAQPDNSVVAATDDAVPGEPAADATPTD